jgi:flagellar hook assembly protein FlgD
VIAMKKISLLVSVRNLARLSLLALAFAAPSDRLFAPVRVSQTVPAKIFTPNGDGINDTFSVTVSNPSASILTQKKIYDLTGAEVTDFQVIGNETDPIVTLSWNGKDGDGAFVRSGIYIYQIQAEGQAVNGTVVVAR